MKIEPFSGAIADFIIDRRRPLVAIVVALTALFGYFAPGMKPDTSMKSGIGADSPDYVRYLDFLEEFGNEEFILIAVRTKQGVEDPRVIRAIVAVTKDLEESPHAEEVLTLSNLRIFRQKDGRFGSYPLIGVENGAAVAADPDELRLLRNAVPALDMLVSESLKTFGLLVRMSEAEGYDPAAIGALTDSIEAILDKRLPEGSSYRMVGSPIIRGAIHRYNQRTAAVFGILCIVISSLISVYIFKSLKVTLITLLVIGISVTWVTGAMTLAGVRLNSVTALSFGLILIVSVAAVVHIVTHFNQRFHVGGDRIGAAREALSITARPCLMCSLTTAAGFASITVSSIPMVRELGFIMALGVLLSYVIAVVVTPALLILMPPPSAQILSRMSRDRVAVIFDRMERFVFDHHKLCAALGIGTVAVMVAGVPFIRSDPQILRMLGDSTPEMQDLNFVEENLAPVHSLEVVISAQPGAFKNAEAWRQVRRFVEGLETAPEIHRTESLLNVMRYLDRIIAENGAAGDSLFTKSGAIPQYLAMMSLSPGGRRILDRYMNEDADEIRVSVRIINSPDTPLSRTIDRIKSAGREVFGPHAKVAATGALQVFEAQGAELVRAQTVSLILALTCITILMTLQFKSVRFGLLSLIPNMFPLAVIFGIMGWFGLRLDNVTIFAATVSIGLSVDDTIHYLTQLRRETDAAGAETDVESCLARAYQTTAKALISTSAVLFFGFLILLWSPFRPVVSFGLLGSSAIVAALVADLVFLPALILSVPLIKRLVRKEMLASGWKP